FGRPQRVETAGGQVFDIYYWGERRLDVVLPVRTRGNAFEPVRVGWQLDPWGRPERVAGPLVVTRYVRGPDGEILRAARRSGETQPPAKGEEATAQRRQFQWDGRGFWVGEVHPELGPASSAEGAVGWFRDAAGRPSGLAGGFSKLSLGLEPRGRFSRLRVAGRTLAEVLWGSAQRPGDLRRGHPVRVSRYSRDGAGAEWHVEETQGYGSSATGPTFRRTELHRSSEGGAPAWSATFEQDWREPLPGGERWTYPELVEHQGEVQRSEPTVVAVSELAGRITRLRAASSAKASFSYHPDGQLHLVRSGDGTSHLHLRPSAGSQRLRVRGLNEGSLYDSGPIQTDSLDFRWGDGSERFVFDAEGRMKIAALRRICERCRQELTYDPFDNVVNTYRNGAFDWDFVVDTKNRLKVPPGDPGGEVTYDDSGRVSRLGWSWQAPPPALQSLTLDFDDVGHLARIRAGSAEQPYRDWSLVPGPSGRPAVILDHRTASASLAIRDLSGRPLSRWILKLPTPETEAKLDLDREILYGPGESPAWIAETPAAGSPRYYLLDSTGTPRFATAEGQEAPDGAPTFYPFGRPAGEGSQEPFAWTWAGHEQLPEGLTLAPEGRPYSFQLLRFLVPGSWASTWNLYGLVPPQVGQETPTRAPAGLRQTLELGKEGVWKTLVEDENEGLDVPMLFDRGQLPIEQPPEHPGSDLFGRSPQSLDR
ncbi:MAG: hypothetical protein KDD47_22630, partial [Acidobacteria bacterium]|nr:hypothetical protein [Acidobacteriota bacterium]